MASLLTSSNCLHFPRRCFISARELVWSCLAEWSYRLQEFRDWTRDCYFMWAFDSFVVSIWMFYYIYEMYQSREDFYCQYVLQVWFRVRLWDFCRVYFQRLSPDISATSFSILSFNYSFSLSFAYTFSLMALSSFSNSLTLSALLSNSALIVAVASVPQFFLFSAFFLSCSIHWPMISISRSRSLTPLLYFSFSYSCIIYNPLQSYQAYFSFAYCWDILDYWAFRDFYRDCFYYSSCLYQVAFYCFYSCSSQHIICSLEYFYYRVYFVYAVWVISCCLSLIVFAIRDYFYACSALMRAQQSSWIDFSISMYASAFCLFSCFKLNNSCCKVDLLSLRAYISSSSACSCLTLPSLILLSFSCSIFSYFSSMYFLPTSSSSTLQSLPSIPCLSSIILLLTSPTSIKHRSLISIISSSLLYSSSCNFFLASSSQRFVVSRQLLYWLRDDTQVFSFESYCLWIRSWLQQVVRAVYVWQCFCYFYSRDFFVFYNRDFVSVYFYIYNEYRSYYSFFEYYFLFLAIVCSRIKILSPSYFISLLNSSFFLPASSISFFRSPIVLSFVSISFFEYSSVWVAIFLIISSLPCSIDSYSLLQAISFFFSSSMVCLNKFPSYLEDDDVGAGSGWLLADYSFVIAAFSVQICLSLARSQLIRSVGSPSPFYLDYSMDR